MDTQRQLLITNALPYANGPLHLGHMVGYIQADIWVRFQKLRGHHCVYVSGDDAHGTPIMLKAKELGIPPEELIAEMKQAHEADFDAFFIAFDEYYSTHSEENRQLAEMIYQRLHDGGHIQTKEILQAYDATAGLFLPDRFVKGGCPRCQAPDQYGDNCEQCGATYSPMDLIEPRSVVSGERPVEKSSLHYFFSLEHFTDFLSQWLQQQQPVPSAVANKLNEWLHEGLKPWDISRDFPYFGFLIPGTTDKYFYVWLDAPIGYMAACKKYCEDPAHASNRLSFNDYFAKEASTELYHFIGKDIVYFHTLFWPAMLQAANFRLPTAIFVNGFLTVNGQKMSKSRGTFITARDYVQFLDPELLRYYFAAKLGSDLTDLDLNFTDFVQRTNADLVGKVINIASRTARILQEHFASMLSDTLPTEQSLLQQFAAQSAYIAQHYEAREFHFVVREVMRLADLVNQYIAEQQPWKLVKEIASRKDAQQICTYALNLFKQLVFFLKPILPKTAHNVEQWLNIPSVNWHNFSELLLGRSILPYEPLLTRIDEQKVSALLQTLKK